jgi:hypothetical protein
MIECERGVCMLLWIKEKGFGVMGARGGVTLLCWQVFVCPMISQLVIESRKVHTHTCCWLLRCCWPGGVTGGVRSD